MMASMRCGQSELAGAIVAEDRPHDVQLHGFEIVELAPDARAWASAWPRFIGLKDRRIYLAATDPFGSEAEITASSAGIAAGRSVRLPRNLARAPVVR
jgi:hypothetical protein